MLLFAGLRYCVFMPSSCSDMEVYNMILYPFYCLSSDVVWELKPKKKSRWKTLSTKDMDLLENSYRQYMETEPLVNDVFNLENGFLV